MRPHVSRRSLFVCTIALVLASSTARNSATSPCEQLKRWASAYAGSTPTLDELSRMDRPHRIAIFNAVSPDVRAMLWQEHLRRFQQRDELSDVQRALVAEAIQLVTPALYRRESAAVRAFERFWTKAEEAFPIDDRRAWLDFGIQSSKRSDEQFCDCQLTGPPGECPGSSCGGGLCAVWQGCGYAGDKECNGKCR